MTPILVFVDFDGVILPIGGGREITDPYNARSSDWELVQVLADALASFPESRVVVSSSWRLTNSKEALAHLMRPIKVFDVTGREQGTRYQEIAEYMTGCATPWLALDDDDTLWPDEERWRLVKCDLFVGLDDASRLAELQRKLEVIRQSTDLDEVRRRLTYIGGIR